MVEIGKFNRLRIIKERSVGYFLDGGAAGDILMPKRHQPEYCEVDDELDVFIFRDAEERLTATVRIPLAQVDECAYLEVVATHRVGAFLNWGMTKDLLVPSSEQAQPMEVGEFHMVKIILDEDDKIIGSSRIQDYIDAEVLPDEYTVGQAVELVMHRETELGWQAIVNHQNFGLLYHSEIFQPLRVGQKLKGFVKEVRPDFKLDLSLRKAGYQVKQVDELGQRILAAARKQNGQLALGDKSDPAQIRQQFQVSKKVFKQALGKLYKQRLVELEPEQLRLTSAGHSYRPQSRQKKQRG